MPYDDDGNVFFRNKRTRTFVAEIVRSVVTEGQLTDAGKIAAIEATFHYSPQATAWPPHLALKKANIILRKPDVMESLRGLYTGAAGFTIVEATRLHVEHIRGVAPERANYQALKDYQAMTLPSQPKRTENKNLNITIPAPPPPEGAPTMAARIIGNPPKSPVLSAGEAD